LTVQTDRCSPPTGLTLFVGFLHSTHSADDTAYIKYLYCKMWFNWKYNNMDTMMHAYAVVTNNLQ
jgi:hypothetical protein